jgi:hypothetical protein
MHTISLKNRTHQEPKLLLESSLQIVQFDRCKAHGGGKRTAGKTGGKNGRQEIMNERRNEGTNEGTNE